MKRLLATATLVGAAAFLPATAAQANHICVYDTSGQPVYCAPHIILHIEQYCVTQSGRPVVCVP